MPHCPLTSYHICRAAAEQEPVSESGVRTAMSIRGKANSGCAPTRPAVRHLQGCARGFQMMKSASGACPWGSPHRWSTMVPGSMSRTSSGRRTSFTRAPSWFPQVKLQQWLLQSVTLLLSAFPNIIFEATFLPRDSSVAGPACQGSRQDVAPDFWRGEDRLLTDDHHRGRSGHRRVPTSIRWPEAAPHRPSGDRGFLSGTASRESSRRVRSTHVSVFSIFTRSTRTISPSLSTSWSRRSRPGTVVLST